MKNKKEISVGIFIIMAIGLLIGLLLYFDKISFSNRHYTVRAKFKDVNNLEIGTLVLLGGVKIGKVSDIELDEGQVLVEMSVDKDIKIYKDSKVVINLKGFIGDLVVNIYNPKEKNRPYSREDILVGQSPTSLNELMKKVENSIDTIEAVGKKVNNISFPEADQTFKNINRLVSNLDRTVTQTNKNINNLVTNLDSTVSETKKVMENSNRIISDNKKKINNLTIETNKLIENLNSLVEKNQMNITETIELLNEFTKLTYETLDENNEDVSKVIENFKLVTEKLKKILQKIEVENVDKINNSIPKLIKTIENFGTLTEDVKGKVSSVEKEKIDKVIKDTEEITEEVKKIMNNKINVSAGSKMDSFGDKEINLGVKLENLGSKKYVNMEIGQVIDGATFYNLMLGKKINKNNLGIGIKNEKLTLGYGYQLTNYLSLDLEYANLNGNNINIGSSFNIQKTEINLKYDLDDIFSLGISYNF